MSNATIKANITIKNHLPTVAVFDSGVGGLTIFKQMLDYFGMCNLIYLADNLRAPFGNRSQQEIKSYTNDILKFLYNNHTIDIIIVACNTICTNALDVVFDWANNLTMNKQIRTQVFSISDITAEYAFSFGIIRKIGVIATRATINSGQYEQLILNQYYKQISYNKACNAQHLISAIENDTPFIYTRACPLLVPFIEEGIFSGVPLEELLKEYIEFFDDKSIEVLILGCTHYSILFNLIEKIMAKYVRVIDPANYICDFLLNNTSILNNTTHVEQQPSHVYYASSANDRFNGLASLLLRRNIQFIQIKLN